METFLKYTKVSSFSLLVLLMFVLLLSGCDQINLISLFSHKKAKEKLDKICEARGGLSSPGPLVVDGYYLPTAGPMFGVGGVLRRLGAERFKYLEMNADWVEKAFSWNDLNPTRIKGKGKYIRFYLADLGDPNCRAYDYYLKNNRGLAGRKLMLRVDGIYPDHCVGAVRTDELKSTYKIGFHQEKDPDLRKVTWGIDEIGNIKTGKSYAEFRAFRYNYIRGGSYICPAPKSEKFKDRDKIYHEILKATPNLALKKKLKVEEIRDPVTVLEDTVSPELIEVVEGKENIKALIFDEVLDLYMSKDAEGLAFFDKRQERWQENGTFYNSDQPQLCVIREEDRRFLKIDISIYDPKKVKTYDFCCLQAIPGDGIYFIATGTRGGHTEKANHFKILKYSWSGKLERISSGGLPIPFSSKYDLGRPRDFYGKLKIGKGYYYFSILETLDQHLSDGAMQPTKEYKFRVPIK